MVANAILPIIWIKIIKIECLHETKFRDPDFAPFKRSIKEEVHSILSHNKNEGLINMNTHG